eukprot:4810143-Ditylum_brightwellii.AAC.1
MEIDAFHEDHGNRTAWEDYSDNSKSEGEWIKAWSKRKGLLSFKPSTEKKEEENAIKKLKNGINTLSMEIQGRNLKFSHGNNSSNNMK